MTIIWRNESSQREVSESNKFIFQEMGSQTDRVLEKKGDSKRGELAEQGR